MHRDREAFCPEGIRVGRKGIAADEEQVSHLGNMVRGERENGKLGVDASRAPAPSIPQDEREELSPKFSHFSFRLPVECRGDYRTSG